MGTRIIFMYIILLSAAISCDKERRIEYYPTGEKRIEVEVNKNGKVHGTLRTFYNSGQIAYEGEYVNDQKVGWHRQYNEKGIIEDEFLYSIRDGKESLDERKKYAPNGLISFHSTNVAKEFKIKLIDDNILVGDTVSVEIEILHPIYENSCVILGSFDQNLNPLEHLSSMKDFTEFNRSLVRVEVIPDKPGKNRFTGLFRDFTIDLVPGSDSLGYRIAEDSYFEFFIVANTVH